MRTELTGYSQARAPPVPELEHHETTSTSSLVDVDSPHVSSVPSDFQSQDVQTTTQAERLEREGADKARAAEKKAKEARAKARSQVSKGSRRLRDNADNPVVLGNAILGVALFGTLGYASYVKYRAGEFSWKLVGIGAAVLGAFGVADYYATKSGSLPLSIAGFKCLQFPGFFSRNTHPRSEHGFSIDGLWMALIYGIGGFSFFFLSTREVLALLPNSTLTLRGVTILI
jgi:Family of unknown function (DUF5353)